MSNINKLIDTIIKDHMLTCQCTDDGRVCMRCQYDACRPKETASEPTFERVPKGVFKRFLHYKDKLYYPFGTGNQQLCWNGLAKSYSVTNLMSSEMLSVDCELIPATFGELKPGEWFNMKQFYMLKINGDQACHAASWGEISIRTYENSNTVLRVSEVLP